MVLREKVELVLVVAASIGAWALTPKLPAVLSVGMILLTCSVILLGQGLLRDLWIKYSTPAPTPEEKSVASRKIFCMCMESTVGSLGVIAGLGILLAGIRSQVYLHSAFWPACIGIVGLVGFVIKDYVLDWREWKIRREKDHRNVIFW